MADPITTQATTLEGQLIEIITAIQAKESNTAANPQNRNFVTATTNLDTRIFASTVSLPMSATVGTGGKLVVEATEYLDVV